MYIYQVKAFGQQCYNLRKFQFRFVSFRKCAINQLYRSINRSKEEEEEEAKTNKKI